MTTAVATPAKLRSLASFPLRSAVCRDYVPSPAPAFSALLAEIHRLMALPPGWDLSDGEPLSREAALASLEFLRVAIDVGAVATLIPLSNGGLLAEWYQARCILQIEWSPTGIGEYDLLTAHEIVLEGTLPADPQRLFESFFDASLNA